MKFRFPIASALLLAAAVPASADIFVLKDGTRLEARILKETDDSYVLDVQISKSIKDEKTIAKADVAEIIEEKPDEKAFPKVQALVPVPDLSPKEEYDRRIAEAEAFIAEYSDSKLAEQAKQIVATLKSEGTDISAGGIKLDGKVIAREEYKSDAYEIDSKILEARIRQTAASQDLVTALRLIARMESDFYQTAQRRALMPLKKQLLNAYKGQIEGQIASLSARRTERDAGLARMSPDARLSTQRALEEEESEAAQRFAAESERETQWVSTHPFHESSLQHAQEQIERELTNERQDPGRDAGRIYRNVMRLIGEQDDEATIRDIIQQASEVDMPARYIENFKEAAKAKGVTF